MHIKTKSHGHVYSSVELGMIKCNCYRDQNFVSTMQNILNEWLRYEEREGFPKSNLGCEIGKRLSFLNHCSSFVNVGIHSFKFLVDFKLPISELS